MSIDHAGHKARVKAVSSEMKHPMTYNDSGAPKYDPLNPRASKDPRLPGSKGDPLLAERSFEQMERGRKSRGEGPPGSAGLFGPDKKRAQWIEDKLARKKSSKAKKK